MRRYHKSIFSVFFALLSLFHVVLANAAPATDPALASATLSNDQVIQWANQAAVAINTYSYSNYQQQFQTYSQQYFTPDSWITYLNNLQNSGNLRTVVEKQLTLAATTNGNATILQQGAIQGHYNWKVQIPIIIDYTNAAGLSNKQAFTVTMDIERSANTPQGISIKRFMMSK